MTQRFTARIQGVQVPDLHPELPPYWIRVAVHDTNEDMRRAMAKMHGLSMRAVGDWGGGFTHAPQPGLNGYLGILRLSRECLPIEFIVHESVHVAVLLAQVHFKADPLRLPRGGKGLREEVVAYVTGSLAESLIEELLVDVPKRSALYPAEELILAADVA